MWAGCHMLYLCEFLLLVTVTVSNSWLGFKFWKMTSHWCTLWWRPTAKIDPNLLNVVCTDVAVLELLCIRCISWVNKQQYPLQFINCKTLYLIFGDEANSWGIYMVPELKTKADTWQWPQNTSPFAVCKRIHEGPGFRIPASRFRIPASGFWISTFWIPDSNLPDSNLLDSGIHTKVDSGF